MVKRRKNKKVKSPFTFGFAKSKKKRRESLLSRMDFSGIFKLLAVVLVLGAICAGLFLWKRDIESRPGKAKYLEPVDKPEWVNNALIKKVELAAGYDGEDFRLDEDVARTVQGNISRVAWLDEVVVQAVREKLLYKAKWRRPIGVVELWAKKFYVDKNLVVLDYVAMPKAPIVEIKGFDAGRVKPKPGEVWRLDDLAAAVKILQALEYRDSINVDFQPLLMEIGSIDVSNFDGRKNRNKPHVVLYAVDGTEIIWGAELGAARRHMEFSDEEKIARLYGYYEHKGTLLNRGDKYINVCDP